MRRLPLLAAAILLAAASSSRAEAPQQAGATMAQPAAPAQSRAAGPEGVFDRLFGSEPERPDASRTERAGRDDLAIVGLYLGTKLLNESMPAFETPAGLCLPVLETLKALELEHQATADGVEIRLHAPKRTVQLRRQDHEGILTDSAKGLCLAVPGWSKLLPVVVRHDPVNLRVVVEATEPLPISSRFEREERRQGQLRPDASPRPDFPAIENPWALLSLPTLDLSTNAQFGSDGLASAIGLEASADLLKMHARVRATLASDGDASLRMALARTSPEPDMLGPLKATSLSLGDVAVPSQPLLADSSTGRGLVVSNRPAERADLFDRIELRGPLPTGWEAELHREDQLLAVVTKPDPLGDYVFADVPLRTGINTYVVRLYGPFGEMEERPFVRVIGAELNAENEVSYTAGFVEESRPLFGPPADSAITRPLVFASFERGLADGLSARVDMRLPLSGGQPAAGASLHAAALGGFGSLLVAGNGKGRPAIALRAVRRFGPLSTSFDLADHGTNPGADQPEDVRELASTAGLSVETRLPLGRRSVPVKASLRRSEERNGTQVDSVMATASLALGSTRLANSLTAEWRTGPGGNEREALGSFGVSRSEGAWRFRGGLDYRIAGGLKADLLSAAASRSHGSGSVSAEVGWDHQRSSASVSLSADQRLGAFSLAAGAGVGASGWRAGLSLSVGLFHAPGQGYQAAPTGISRSGTLRPLLFVDDDADGVQDASEPGLAGGRFVADNSIRQEVTSEEGAALLDGLAPGRSIDLEVQLASLPDMALRPVKPGVAARLRPGQVLDVPVPLRPTGEVEARVMLTKGEVQNPLSGIEVVLLDPDGKRIAATVSDFDGWAYFEAVPLGSYRLAALPGKPDEASVSVNLVKGAAVSTGQVLRIRR